MLGEAHIIHPLAGQGFNLALRDGAQLVEALYGGAFGLAFDAPGALGISKKVPRRWWRHGCDYGLGREIFSGQAKTWTRPVALSLGLAMVGIMAGKSRQSPNKACAGQWRHQP